MYTIYVYVYTCIHICENWEVVVWAGNQAFWGWHTGGFVHCMDCDKLPGSYKVILKIDGQLLGPFLVLVDQVLLLTLATFTQD